MVRRANMPREKRRGKVDLDGEKKAEDAGKSSKSFLILSSSDDEEANEDPRLKNVEKALLMRAAKLAPDDAVLGETSGGGGGSSGVVALSSSSALDEEVVEAPGGVGGSDGIVSSGKKKALKRVRIKKKIKKMEVGEETVIFAKDKEKEETVKASDIVESVEPPAVEITDNIVFRKLLRGPRYFDPPDSSSWGKCFNCGEEGHIMAKCAAVKRKKPCFVCGSLEHSAKQCSKGQDCFICKKGGHQAKDCPEKHKGGSLSLKICLKCGDSGHDMFSCWNDYYSPDDLMGIQCYICKGFGHLCCGNSVKTSPGVISCYKCGQLGHTGLACAKIHGEDIGTGSSSSCYKCGEEGHFARECMNSAKANKRSREFSTPTLRFHREKNYSEFKSVPLDLSKVRKRKKNRNDEKGIATPQKSKRRGGWIVEDPGDLYHRKSERGRWRSPATPKGHKIAGLTAGGHISSSQSFKKSSTGLSGSSTSQGWSKGFQHRFSAARFGNSGSDGMQRNYSWW